MNGSVARTLALVVVPWILGAAERETPQTPSADLHRGPEYRGAGAFFSVGTLTVVYPAGPGEPVETNRRSAEARARWLAAVHKSKVAVAADDQLTGEQKKGNLLLLGWNNRVLGPGGLSRPFTHGKTGTDMLGVREADPNVDLLVYHRNPLDWSSFILFWSRIDPERDRFQVLPRVGSDWAMYRDYRPIRQGMFVPARVWPPSRDKTAEADHSGDAYAHPGGGATFDSDHYHVVFDPTQFHHDEVRAIVQAREGAFAKAAAAVGTVPKAFRVALFVYEDEKQKKEATGVGDPTHVLLRGREIHMTRRFALAPTPREEVHVLAREIYGPCFLTAVCDGFALSVENSWRGDDMEMHAALMRSAGKLPEPAVLLDEERFRALPEETGPAAAGVFMTWLRQTYGPAGLKKVFALRDGRAAELASTLGVTEGALTASFSSWADACVTARKRDLDFLAAEDEAQKRQIASDWTGMVAALKKALQAKPGDVQTLFNLASAQMRGNDLAGAETSLKNVLAAPLPPDGSRFRVFGHYQLGRVYDLAGRRADALAEYDAVLALPDEHGAHDLARDRKASPATREQLE
jgi:hypothetical protein